MTSTAPVLEETVQGVTVLTLNEPERRNPLTPQIIARLAERLTSLASDDDCRAVVIRGAGRGFCSGADLKRMGNTTMVSDRAELEEILALNRLVWNYPKPTLASVHGFAVGGGASLMAWCDFAFVEEGTKIGFPEIAAGLPSATVVPTLLRTIGRRATLEFALSGKLIDAARASELGLITRAVPVGSAFETAFDWATSLAERNPLAVRMTKEIISAVSEMPYGPGLSYAKEVRVIARAADGFSTDLDSASKAEHS